MSFVRHRSSAASHHDNRLSYIHGPDQSFSTECLYTFDPRKNLNDLFQSISVENVCMENLRVYLRVRPRLEGEVQQNEDTQVDILDERSVILTAPTCSNTFKNSVRGISKLTHKFTFTHVYGPSTTQEELFRSSSLNLITDFVSGQNCLLFTYGATNSGKTFTVQGTPEDAGLLPRTVQHIFSLVGENHYPRNDLKPKFCCNVTRLEEQDVIKEEEKRESIFKIPSNLTTTFSQSTLSILKASMIEDSVNTTESSMASHNTTEAGVSPVLDSANTTSCTNDTTGDLGSLGTTVYAVFVSFAEIYNEYIFDLLEKIPVLKGKRNPLMLGEDYNGAVYIKGLNEVRVKTADEALQLVNIGRQNLHFAATRLNHNSSRSHCIFTVKLVRLADADNPHIARVSVLSLCDLAGAERAAKTCGTQDRLKESGNINTSLLTLSRCIEALRCNQTQKGSKKVPVPYRDSKLTRLFQSFLLGKGRAAMIVNISKMPLLFDETLQVLKFSAVAKQVAITQAKESEVQKVQPSRRVSRLSKMMRQSLKGNGRLSVPWAKGKGSITFGESLCEAKENGEQEVEQEDFLEEDEDDEEEDERVEGLIQLINKLKEELVREHQEKLDLEERLRRELCKEFSQQLVEIQSSWSQRLKDQENLYEELTECKIQALMKSMKKCNKRMRCEEDPDEEYVSSVFLFREQQKVAEQKQEIEELKANENLLKEEVQALKDSQKKINEMATQAKEEKSRLTFRLAQLTASYDKVVQDLEAKSLSVSSSADNTEAMQELRAQLEKKSAQMAEQDKEIQDLQTMLVEAAEYCTGKEDLCSNLEKLLESSRLKNTQHMVYINDLESQLEESRGMLSQQATQMEEREQDIEDLSQLLSKERKSRKEELSKMEEEYIREKSKLLLEVAGLKRNKPVENRGSGEEVKLLTEKVSQLQEEKEALEKSDKSLRERQEQETMEKDKQIKSLEEKLAMMEKQLSQKETDIKEEREEKERRIDELKKIQESVAYQEGQEGEKMAEINRLMQDNEALSSQVQCLKACNEALNSECEDIKSCLKEKKDAEVKLQEDFTACKTELEELEKAYESLKKMEDSQAKLEKDFEKCSASLEEMSKVNTSLKEQLNAKVEMEELERARTLLKKEIDAKTELQEDLNTCQTHLETLQTTHTSLEEEREALQKKLHDQTNLLEKLKAENEEEAAKNSAMCEKLKDEIEELKMMKVGQDDAVKEVSQLRVRLEAEVEQIKEEKSQVQMQVEMLEIDKKMGERLYNLQEASHLKAQKAQSEIETLQEQIEILLKDKITLEAGVEAAQRQTQEQTSRLQEKEEVVQALSSKIESLDAKLNRAEEEEQGKKQLEEELKASQAMVIRLDTKCELLEKEILALREARQAEVHESFNRTKDHEEFAKQKEAEISTLQQEVKKLLQQSMSSSRSSIADPPPLKAETPGLKEELVSLKEQFRLTVAHNNTLIQEVNSLRNQMARQSTSSDVRVLQVQASKTSQKNQRDASISDKEGFVTPIPKERKGRKGRAATRTPNTSACLDSSLGYERQSRDASPVISPPSAPTNSAGRPQRATRRTMRYDSEEYVLDYKVKPVEDGAWEPPRLKGSRRTKTPKSKVSGVSKPILQDQENKSSMANKADMIQESDVEPEAEAESKTGRRKASTRRRRPLYDSDAFEEPFLCAPELVCEAPEDSPMTTVRRQLRNKRK